MKARNLRAKKWLIVKIIDVLLAMIAEPLAFYTALCYDQEASLEFWVCLILLTLITGIGVSITWWVWGILKER